MYLSCVYHNLFSYKFRYRLSCLGQDKVILIQHDLKICHVTPDIVSPLNVALEMINILRFVIAEIASIDRSVLVNKFVMSSKLILSLTNKAAVQAFQILALRMLHHVSLKIRLVHSFEVTLTAVISWHSLLMCSHVFAEACLLGVLITAHLTLIYLIHVSIGMVSLDMKVEEDLLLGPVVALLTLELHIALEAVFLELVLTGEQSVAMLAVEQVTSMVLNMC